MCWPSRLALVFIAITAMALTAGCGAGGGTATLPTVTGVTQFVTKQAGGTVSDTGLASIQIGQNSLAQDAEVTVGPPSSVPAAPTGFTVIPNTAVSVNSGGVPINSNATLTISYSTANLGTLTTANLQVYEVSGTSWVLVPGSVVFANASEVVVSISQFGTYALLDH